MNTVAIIDYGMGNLHSISKAIKHVASYSGLENTKVLVTSDAATIREADRVVLPGVGAIRDCMTEIRRLGFEELIKEVSQDRPFLGICVGMQALMTHSEENNGVNCIDLFPGHVRFFGTPLMEKGVKLKVPHMGWNQVKQTRNHPLWHSIDDEERFYFVHSFFVEKESDGDSSYVMGEAHYGKEISAAIGKNNIFAVQFHPEKSQHAGLALLNNFIRWDGKP
jgi:imidazole glycerol phosphate synthase subunit hisH (EC 2.4.2.-)